MIYLDNNATTKPAPEVVEAMVAVLREGYGNPSSSHVLGQTAAFKVQEARAKVAGALGAKASEIIFTSGGTESDNLAIRGALAANPTKKHFVTCAVEHDAVIRTAKDLEAEGYEVTYLDVDTNGQLDLIGLEHALRPDTALASFMLANNETGVILPISQIARICHDKQVPLHTDAVQAIGKINVDVNELQADLLSLSAHKFHGPKGVGALYVRTGLRIQPQVVGGSQEKGLRGGTENVPGIVGMGVAAELVTQRLEDTASSVQQLRDSLESEILQRIPCARVVAADSPRLPNTSNIAFVNLVGEHILVALSEQGIFASGGAACHSGSLEPSGVLTAMNLEPTVALGAVRFSLAHDSTTAEVAKLLEVLPKVADTLQQHSGRSECPIR